MTAKHEIHTESVRDLSPWLTKIAAARELNCSERTIENYIAEHKLSSRPQPQHGRRPITVVDPDDVARLKAEQNRGVLLAAPPVKIEPGPQELAVADTLPRAVAAIAQLVAQRAPRPFMTLAQAAEYTGLPEALLKRFIRRGELPCALYKRETYVRTVDVAGLELELVTPKVKPRPTSPDIEWGPTGGFQQ